MKVEAKEYKLWVAIWDGKSGIDAWPIVALGTPCVDTLRDELCMGGFNRDTDYLRIDGPWSIEEGMQHNMGEVTN